MVIKAVGKPKLHNQYGLSFTIQLIEPVGEGTIKKATELLEKQLTKEGLFSCGDDLEWERVRTFMAIGSGAMAAEVCMRMGLTAEKAVEWACNVDANSSGPIKTYTLTDAV